jgi:hypothetical protein
MSRLIKKREVLLEILKRRKYSKFFRNEKFHINKIKKYRILNFKKNLLIKSKKIIKKISKLVNEKKAKVYKNVKKSKKFLPFDKYLKGYKFKA